MAAQLQGISKSFGFTTALAGVELTIRAGEVLALLGENGAGKSTLVKVLTGVIAPDAGTIEIDGVDHDALTPRHAEELGIARVAQELSLFPEMNVAANVLIGREPRRFGLVDRRALHRRTSELLGLLGIPLDTRLAVRRLSLAERQLVEIAKAMARTPRILVLDEPTSGLREHEVERLFEVIRGLRQRGCAVVFISHRLEEVFAIADRIAVLKDGRNSGEVERADAGRDARRADDGRPGGGESVSSTKGQSPTSRRTSSVCQRCVRSASASSAPMCPASTWRSTPARSAGWPACRVRARRPSSKDCSACVALPGVSTSAVIAARSGIPA